MAQTIKNKYLHYPTGKIYISNGAGRLVREDKSTNESLPLWLKDNSSDWKQIFRIGDPRITIPNMVGELVKETPKMIIVKIISRTFEDKSSKTITHKFTKENIEWYTKCVGFQRKFWKENGLECNGKTFIIE